METLQLAYRKQPGMFRSLPFVDITLTNSDIGQSCVAPALVDSGAMTNVLPYSLGLELGLDWNAQEYVISIGGGTGRIEGYAVLLEGQIASFPSTPLGFAWVRSDQLRLILGQSNFFQQYHLHFYGDRECFEITP